MPTNPPQFYGMGLVLDAAAGQMRPPVLADVAANMLIYGLYVRPYPTQSGQDPLGTDTPPTNGVANVLKRGYMTVLLRGTSAAVKGGPVRVWAGAPAGGNVPGGITADNTAGQFIQLPIAYFMGPADAQGFTEIAFNL